MTRSTHLACAGYLARLAGINQPGGAAELGGSIQSGSRDENSSSNSGSSQQEAGEMADANGIPSAGLERQREGSRSGAERLASVGTGL